MELFEECFSTKISANLWKWAYLDNVFGDPVVAMSFADNKLVGHYAVVPFFLKNKKGNTIKSALSMTTMVAKSHRKLSLFTGLARNVYSELVSQNYDLVYGFPNPMSAQVLNKVLNWQLAAPDYLAKVTKEQLIKSKDLKCFLSEKDRFGFDISDKKNVGWRLGNPDLNYLVKNAIITKKYDGDCDLMYLSEETLEQLETDREYNVLLDASVNDLICYKTSEYQFGYKNLSKAKNLVKFDKNMIMSDIF